VTGSIEGRRMPLVTPPGAFGIVVVSAALACAGPLPGQEDSVTVVAGARYAAGSTERRLLGTEYRDLWTTPVRVPVLRPDTFAGGLTVVRRGTSPQTLSLRFEAAGGRQYVFRSVDKEQREGLPADLRGTLVEYVVQDKVSSKHPGAALVVAGLLEAAGVLHVRPRLAVMADHPLLGEHRETFAGMLGTMEERPDEVEDGPGFGGFERIIGTERLLERLRESPDDRVDARAYLAARLVDALVGDWDRNPDQWRWAQDTRGPVRYWLAIPRDRDNALSHIDGWIARVDARMRPTALRFEDRYPAAYGLVYASQVLDRRLLSELPVAAWDSVAHEVRRRITDGAIADAVARMPPEWVALGGERLATTLRARRDALPGVARDLFGLLAREVEVHGTDEVDRAEVERLEDGSVRVRLVSPGRDHRVHFERHFLPSETREVRIHLEGGADTATVRGAGGGITVRLIGGEGDDLLEDASRTARGARTLLHDHQGDDRLVGGPRTRIDRRVPREAGRTARFRPEAEGDPPPPRDWGATRSPLAFEARWPGEIGPVVGGGPSWTRYGFRRFPVAAEARVTVLYAPLHGRPAVEARARTFRTGGGGETRLAAGVSRIAHTNFHGFGNETRRHDAGIARVWATEYAASAEVVRDLGRGVRAGAAPVVRIVAPEPREGSPAAAAGVAGARTFGVAGVRLDATVARGDTAGYRRRGAGLRARASGYPLAWGDAPSPFARGGATAWGYLPLPGPFEPTLAARAGAARVWGDAPFQYAPSVGGTSTLRGHPRERFTGDASAHVSGELRTRLGRVNLRVLRGELGALLLADAGRVFVAGEGSGRWHTGHGGGVWFGAVERSLLAHLLLVRGERSRLQAGIGLPF
jgi:hypothetical protein